VQHAGREAALAGHGEVPGEVELAPLDAGLPERTEDPLEMAPALLDRACPGLDPVAVEAKAAPRLELRPARALEIAQRDDVALTLVEVAPGG